MTPARPALELLEEAVHLLRMSPARIHALYFAGTIPFLLGFLFFWTEMSRNVRAEDQLVEWSLALALLFVWMKCWQAAAASELLAHCARAARPPWSWARIRRLIYIQGVWQPTKLIALPMAALPNCGCKALPSRALASVPRPALSKPGEVTEVPANSNPTFSPASVVT